MTLSALAVPIAAHTALVSLLLCLTSKHSPLRLAAVPVVGIWTFQACKALDFFNDNQFVNPMTSGYMIFFAIHHIHILVIAGIDSTDMVRKTTLAQRLRTALYFMSTPRGVGTAYETKDLKYQPSCRWKFLTWNLFVLGFQYLLMDLVTHQPTSPKDIERFFSPGREYLLFRPDDVSSPTLTEAVIHLAVTLVAWGPMGASFISIFYRIVALLSVALGISSPNQWPSLFGSISDTYRLRRFWGRYWHQLLRQPFQGITKLITRDILRLPHQSHLARYLGLVLVFACSALLHACMDAKAGISFKLSGAWACFLLQAVGITLEDTAVGVYTRVFRDSQSQSQSTPLWMRLLGYVWVWGFLALVAPLYQFPLMRGQDPMRTGMPVSVVRWLRAYFAV